jgi:hypothetical protein
MVIKVQPGCEIELNRTFEQEVIPLLRKEKEFRGLLAFTLPDGTQALAFSFWEHKENSRGFITRSLAALTALARVAVGKSSVQVCEVGNSLSASREQVTRPGEGVEATAELRIYQSALHPFKVAPTRATTGRGFPLIWGLINSFHI